MTADPEVVEDSKGTPKRDEDGHLIPKATPEGEIDDEEKPRNTRRLHVLGAVHGSDITFDPATILRKKNDPEALGDFRTPRLDLENLFGRAGRPALHVSARRVGLPPPGAI